MRLNCLILPASLETNSIIDDLVKMLKIQTLHVSTDCFFNNNLDELIF